MSRFDMSADMATADMSSQARYYEPGLDELGPPEKECGLTVIDARAAEQPRSARQFITSYRLDPSQLIDHKTYREHIHQIIHEQVLPCRAPDVPNVVIWPGSMSLPLLLIGQKAATARELGDSANALAQMLRQLARASSYYKGRFPEATLAQNLLLALTDSNARGLMDTFGQLADRYDLYISVSANLPKFERTQDPELIRELGDPDYEGLGEVYVATEAQIKSRTLLFGPDGKLVAERERAYVTPAESAVLSLQGADLASIKPISSPWGRVGVLEGPQAWMPDVQDRLDDLGAQHYLQPAANEGGWVLPVEAQDRLWRPDVFMFSGWSQVQRSPRALDSVASQLTGRLLDATFDGQTQVVTRANRQAQLSSFVGQDAAQSPSLFVGPWALPEPPGASTMSVEQRRQELRRSATALYGGRGEFVQGSWAVDISTPEEQVVATHPAGELMSDGSLALVASVGKIGQRKLRLTIGKAQGPTHEELIAGPAGAELVRPQLVLTSNDEVLIVAEAVALDGSYNKLFWVRYDGRAFKLLEGDLLETRSAWSFQPWLWRVGRRVLLSWVRVDGASRQAVLMQGSFSSTGGGVFANATPQPISPVSNVRAAAAPHHWGVRVAATSDKLAAVWLDFGGGRWQVLVSVSVDGGLSWSPAAKVDETPEEVAAYHESPTISVHPEGFVVAWTDKSSLRAGARIMVRKLGVLATGALKLGPSLEASEEGWAFRPELVEGPLGGSWLGYEQLGAKGWSVQRALLPVTLDGVLERREHKLDGGDAAHFVRLLRGAALNQVRAVYERVSPSGASMVEVVEPW